MTGRKFINNGHQLNVEESNLENIKKTNKNINSILHTGKGDSLKKFLKVKYFLTVRTNKKQKTKSRTK